MTNTATTMHTTTPKKSQVSHTLTAVTWTCLKCQIAGFVGKQDGHVTYKLHDPSLWVLR